MFVFSSQHSWKQMMIISTVAISFIIQAFLVYLLCYITNSIQITLEKQIRTVIPSIFFNTLHISMSLIPQKSDSFTFKQVFLFFSCRIDTTKSGLVSSLQYRKSMRLNDDTGNFIGAWFRRLVCVTNNLFRLFSRSKEPHNS